MRRISALALFGTRVQGIASMVRTKCNRKNLGSVDTNFRAAKMVNRGNMEVGLRYEKIKIKFDCVLLSLGP